MRIAWLLPLLASLGLSACGGLASTKGPCEGLAYEEGGPSRAAYLPCIAEMLNAMDEVRVQIAAELEGNEAALSRARGCLVKVQRLRMAAGGRKLLDRWEDEALTGLNVDLYNAYSGYQAVVMPMGLVRMDAKLKAQVHLSHEHDFQNANDSLESARQTYKLLR